MKSITCDKCHRLLEPTEPYRELSSGQFVTHIGDTRTLMFEHYATYDLCDKCNEEFNTFIRSSIYQFLKGNET